MMTFVLVWLLFGVGNLIYICNAVGKVSNFVAIGFLILGPIPLVGFLLGLLK